MFLRQIFDPYLAQYAYLVGCQRTGEALVIDPQRDIDRYQDLAVENGLRITAVAETHIHADFVSGAAQFATDPAIHLYLSDEGGPDWSYRWPGSRSNTHRLKHCDRFMVGKIQIEAIHTPGHTPEHLSYLVTDLGAGINEPVVLATGDFVFVGDVGRPDLLECAAGKKGSMEPAASQLQESLRDRLTNLPDFLQLLPGHGAGSACGKALGAVSTTTLGYERRFNGALGLALRDRSAFVREILSGQPEPPLYFAAMKRVNRDGSQVTEGVPMPPHLTPDLFRNIAGHRPTRVLDTRVDREEFDAAHVARAIQAPLRSPFFLTAVASYVDESDTILLVLESASDVDLAARQLYRANFDYVAGWITVEEAQTAGLMADTVERIDFSEFDPERARSEGEIIDVRSAAEYQTGHLGDARSIPFTRLKARLDELSRDRRLFVHCASGKRASLAASYLRAEGFDAVHVDGVCVECERLAEAHGAAH